MRKNVHIIYLILCSLFFLTGYIWGRHGITVISQILWKNERKGNINEYLKDTKIVEINTNKLCRLDSLISYKRNIIIFWSPTCAYCKKFFTDFKLPSKDVGFLGIPLIEDLDYFKYYIKSNKIITNQILTLDNEGNIIDKFGIKAIPEILVVDNYGEILYSQIGAEIKEEFLNALKVN